MGILVRAERDPPVLFDLLVQLHPQHEARSLRQVQVEMLLEADGESLTVIALLLVGYCRIDTVVDALVLIGIDESGLGQNAIIAKVGAGAHEPGL